MTYYYDGQFLKHLDVDAVKYVCEAGARYGDESIQLSNTFKNAQIFSFECNPNTVDICYEKLRQYNRIKFFNRGLGHVAEKLPFYSFKSDNDGCSSLLKRIDCESTQTLSGHILIDTLASVMSTEKVPYLDLLCMDVQGYELNILKGCGSFLEKIKYVIMEEPNPIINTNYLPANVHSKYIGAPTSSEIKEFMNTNNFIEIERIQENYIEDNVMYKNVLYKN